MARFIEAVKCAEIISEKFNIPLADLVDVFAEIPTADVVEVVRCKDCDFCIKMDEPQTIMYPDLTRKTYFLRCRIFNNFCVENEFCSCGERSDT